MQFITSIALASSVLISAVSAQVSYNSATDTWTCPNNSNGSFCASDSLLSPVVILCDNGVGTPGNCIPHAWNRPPIDVYYSQCYQSSETAGDAACAKSCMVYPDSGLPFPVPGACNATALNEVDVTGGQVAVTCHNGLLPHSNETGVVCDASFTSNNTIMGTNTTSSSGNKTTPSGSHTSGAPGSTSTPSPKTGAGVALTIGPLAGYAVLGLAAFFAL